MICKKIAILLKNKRIAIVCLDFLLSLDYHIEKQ